MSKYLVASFFGGLIGACCALIVVYVINTNALVVTVSHIHDAVAMLHSRINDFYIFAGIVITLLLAINVGVYIKAEDEIERHFMKNYEKYQRRFEDIYNKSALAKGERKPRKPKNQNHGAEN